VPSHRGTLAQPGEYDWTCAFFAAPKSTTQIDRFSLFAQLTAECSRACPGMSFSLIISPSHGASGPRLTHYSLGPSKQKIQNSIWISLAIFAQFTAECPYTLQWVAPSPSKLPLPMGDVDPDLIRGCLGPSKSTSQTASRLVQLPMQLNRCCGRPMYQQMDRSRYSVGNNRLHLHT